MGEARPGAVAPTERGPDWRRRTLGRSAGSGPRLRRGPVSVHEASRAPVGSYVTFRVFSERHPYGWDASGIVHRNELDRKGELILQEYGRKTYTIPWRYFVNELVFTFLTQR